MSMQLRLAAALTWAIISAALIGGSMRLDRRVSSWVMEHRPLHLARATTLDNDAIARRIDRDDGPHGATFIALEWIFRYPVWHLGRASAAVLAAGLLAWRHPLRWRATGYFCICCIAAGMTEFLVKWSVGRSRPGKGIDAFDLSPFRGGWGGIFHQDNLSCPSGHAILAGAMAMALCLLLPRWSLVFVAAALLVCVQRVLANAHWMSDNAIGLSLGSGAALLLYGALARQWRLHQPRPLQTI